MYKNYLDLNNYLYIAKMIVVSNGATQETFQDLICNFRCEKYVKKGYMEMTKKKFTLTL